MMMYCQHYLLLRFDAGTSNHIEFSFQVPFLALETVAGGGRGVPHHR